MAENKLVVDLGSLILTPEQEKKMTSAIHSAVAGELADIAGNGRLGLFPITKFPGGQTAGLIVRDFSKLTDTQFTELVK